jgi:MFS family permease
MFIDDETKAGLPWYRTLNATQWKTLLASNLGWVFDGFEAFALILTVGLAMHQLLSPADLANLPTYAGGIIALTLIGWAIGGMAAGVVADYIGRKRTMILSILAYSIMTGLSAIAWDWTSFAVMRFLVGLAIGAEWVTGTAMTAEFWPDHARGRGAGLFQCGFGIGFFLASLIWLFVSGTGAGAWRTMYLIGVLPALLTLWIRQSIPESTLWEDESKRRRVVAERERRGEAISADEQALTSFTLTELFAEPEIRRRTIVGLTMATASAVGFWAISTWVPPFGGAMAAKTGLPAAQWASYTGMSFTAGTIVGYVAFGFFADIFGRKPITMLYFALSLLLTPVMFLWISSLTTLLTIAALLGCFSSGQFTWMSTWLPELYPTRMRATGAGFIFNASRIPAAFGVLIASAIIAQLGGYGNAAMTIATVYLLGLAAAPFLPETHGKPLPR